ncbi:MAG: 6-phosphogluconolactonase [Actinomycetota bacterium]|nr:6-phosphogluconolactonase [Actinomycetota bacterium]
MNRQPEIVVSASADQLAENAAARLIACLVTALDERPVAHIVLTGGSILEQFMRAVRDLPARDSVDWARVHVWWGDERYVPTGDDERNDKAAFAALLGSLALDPALVHRMPASDAGFADVEQAARAYAAALAKAAAPGEAAGPTQAVPPPSGADIPRFDVALLGIGPDGHLASLFPEHPGVYEDAASVIGVRNSPKPPPLRLSLTFRSFDAATEVWFIASGQSKAKAVAMALRGAHRDQVPAAGPSGRLRTLWLIDRLAASELPADLHQPPPT